MTSAGGRTSRGLSKGSAFLPLMAALPALAAQATLPEGLTAEPTALGMMVRVGLGLLGFLLILFGRRFGRLTMGTFFLMAGEVAAFGLFSGVSYPLALLMGWLVFALGMLIHAFVPRLAVGLACLWPLAAVYGAWIYFTGAFGVNRWLMVGLVLAGGALGAVGPRLGLTLLASAMGTVFVALVSPFEPRFAWTVGLFAAAVCWQTLIYGWFRRSWPSPQKPTLADKRRGWFQALGWGALSLALVGLAAALLAPRPDASASPDPGRLAALREKGALSRPGLILSTESNYYLFGRALPVALVGPRGDFLDRLGLLALGRSPAKAIGAMRAVKDADEQAKMIKAADITSRAFEDIAPLIRPGVNEGDIEKAILASYARNGADGIAFRSIVGSGTNATLPHYMANDAVMKDGLVVIDIGCSYRHYASDMTRTFPVNGTLTEPERKLMELVVAAGDAARARLKPGVTQKELDSAAREVIKKGGFGPFFNHALGHPVGLDVHDAWITGPLEPGMVITIEPGIYVPEGSRADRAYWGLGVRIEDSYLVTKDGYQELTHFPKIPGEEPPARAPVATAGPAAPGAPAPSEAAGSAKD